jgi:uncharacterized protein (DUF2225 family)
MLAQVQATAGSQLRTRTREEGFVATLRDITLACPICGTRFRSRVVETVAGLGPLRMSTDFRESAGGADELPFQVHQCLGCGFAGGDDEFTVHEADEEWASAVDAETREGFDGDIAGSAKYEAAARVAAWRGRGARAAADLLLRAAWCCIAEHDHEAERYFRREAARMYERALAAYDDVPRERRARLTYLTGELWRRAGDERRAHAWFDRVADEVTDRANQGWIVALARKQRVDPKEWIG